MLIKRPQQFGRVFLSCRGTQKCFYSPECRAMLVSSAVVIGQTSGKIAVFKGEKFICYTSNQPPSAGAIYVSHQCPPTSHFVFPMSHLKFWFFCYAAFVFFVARGLIPRCLRRKASSGAGCRACPAVEIPFILFY